MALVLCLLSPFYGRRIRTSQKNKGLRGQSSGGLDFVDSREAEFSSLKQQLVRMANIFCVPSAMLLVAKNHRKEKEKKASRTCLL